MRYLATLTKKLEGEINYNLSVEISATESGVVNFHTLSEEVKTQRQNIDFEKAKKYLVNMTQSWLSPKQTAQYEIKAIEGYMEFICLNIEDVIDD